MVLSVHKIKHKTGVDYTNHLSVIIQSIAMHAKEHVQNH